MTGAVIRATHWNEKEREVDVEIEQRGVRSVYKISLRGQQRYRYRYRQRETERERD
jgi:hypothetical protein